MKTLAKIAACFVITVCLLTLCVSAIEEGDYGYSDVTSDGKIEIIDVLGILQQVVNSEHDNGGLLRVIRTLKLVASGNVINAVITEIDAENNTVTLSSASGSYTVPMQKIGFDKNYNLDFYLDGTVTMTVSGDFTTSKDVNLIHAANAFSLYDINEIHLTADSTTAIINGEEHTLYAAPIMKDGTLMINAGFLAEELEVVVSWDNTTMTARFRDSENELEMTLDSKTAILNGETVTLDVPMITVDMRTYIPAAFVAETFGAVATFYEDTSTLVIVKQFLPTFSITDASGKAGEEVSVTVAVSHNPGVAGLQVELGYDPAVLSYTSAQTVSNGMYASASPTSGVNPVKIVMAHLGLKNVSGDLTLGTVNFAISENATAGSSSISFTDAQIYYANNDEICSMKAETVPCVIRVTE